MSIPLLHSYNGGEEKEKTELKNKIKNEVLKIVNFDAIP